MNRYDKPFHFYAPKELDYFIIQEYTKQLLGAYANSGIGWLYLILVCAVRITQCCINLSEACLVECTGVRREKVRGKELSDTPSGLCSLLGSYLVSYQPSEQHSVNLCVLIFKV